MSQIFIESRPDVRTRVRCWRQGSEGNRQHPCLPGDFILIRAKDSLKSKLMTGCIASMDWDKYHVRSTVVLDVLFEDRQVSCILKNDSETST